MYVLSLVNGESIIRGCAWDTRTGKPLSPTLPERGYEFTRAMECGEWEMTGIEYLRIRDHEILN